MLTGLVFASCFDDLNTIPLDKDIVTSAVVYDDPATYKRVLAKLYAGLAVSGQQGPSGQADIAGIDEGFGQYLRGLWYHQELSTDEAVIGWNDQTIKDFHEQDWTASDNFINAFYSRIFYQISLCNEFLRETTDEKIANRDQQSLSAEIATYRAEARFLRALSYWHALDLFRNVPFVTEADKVGAFFPNQISGSDLYNYLESELLAIENELVPSGQNEYGRVDQTGVQMLLAKLYLNAEVYTGQNAYAKAAEYSEKVVNSSYSLDDQYQDLFMADNHTSPEIIFPVISDGINTRTWGGMTFIIHAAVGGSMQPADFGIDGGWGGTRTTSALVNQFPSVGVGSVLVEANRTDPSYPVLYVPGGHQGWDPANPATVLNSSESNSQYEAYFYFADDNTELKITDGPGWDVNYGDNDADGILDQNGGNIVIPSSGVYRVTVNLDDLSYSITRVEWGVIGDATPGGWDSDQDMTYDPELNAWTITLDLSPGEIKFRANDGWDLNLGDNDGNALLQYGGANIAIPASGNYRITLYLDGADYTYSIEQPAVDGRAIFFTDGQELEIEDISQFTQGYAVSKFKNITTDGNVGSDLTFPDTDFPMFRLADAHLMYAEAVLRGGGGSRSKALELVNEVRSRGYNGTGGTISESELTLDFILAERARELHWECHRRTDLIRYGQFTNGTYLWPWKGGVPEGIEVSPTYNLYPIPANDLGANPNLIQNPGY